MVRDTLYALILGASACADAPDLQHADTDAGLELARTVRQQVVPLLLGSPLSAELSASAPTYLFSFTLTGKAAVSLRTTAAPAGAEVDTVLTLSKLDQYGQPRPLGTSNDFDGGLFSALDRTLGKGSYRVLVRGHTLRNRGPFVLTSTCVGAGCPLPPASCLFGEQFSDLRTSSTLEITSEEWLTSEAQLSTVLMRDQLVLDVQQSAHTDVSTPAQAFAAVDQNEVRHMELHERSGTRAFTVYEYGAGDNSYGAIFDATTTTIAASIHDGELLNCETE